jgi:hypothetical protein
MQFGSFSELHLAIELVVTGKNPGDSGNSATDHLRGLQVTAVKERQTDNSENWTQLGLNWLCLQSHLWIITSRLHPNNLHSCNKILKSPIG